MVMGEPAVRFQGVTKNFGPARVLRHIELEVRPGRFVGLAGVNGAGKTTLIRCLLDFCELDAGSITIHGVQHRRPEARARLAFLPERFMPPYYLTGVEFLRTMLGLVGARYDEAAARRACETLDLPQEALAKPVRAYSKGMTQKLGLAACLLSGRDLFILDEPMSGLDPRARALAKRLLLELKERGRTLLFTSHLLADVEEICDELAVLHDGRIVFFGAPQGLRERHGGASLDEAFLNCIESGAGHA